MTNADDDTFRLLSLQPSAITPLQEQVYQRVVDALADGHLQAGQRLPSTRSLAAQLNVARGTIDAAYSRLSGDGFVTTGGARGTQVAPNASGRARALRALSATPPTHDAPGEDYLWPFRGGIPSLDLFPRKLWTGLASKSARLLDAQRMCYPDPRGLPALRKAVLAYLSVSRGIACDPAQVIITGGYQAALQVVMSLVLHAGDEVLFEDPGYRFARRTIEAAKMRLSYLPVDGCGVVTDAAAREHRDARLAVVTPGHQSPLGVALAPARRQALLDWAHRCDAWVLEDDYDSEFQYVGRKPPALKNTDPLDRVFHAGSFSKTLIPGLRLGYLVVPKVWIDAATSACELADRGRPVHEQSILAAFISDGHYARHLRRMRLIYAERSKALVGALRSEFGSGIDVDVPEGGLTLTARFPGREHDALLVERARSYRLAPSALSAHARRFDIGSGLLLGFTNTRVDDAIDHARRLRAALDGS